jgi:hypothetical protein
LFKSKDVPELTYSQVIRNVETLLATWDAGDYWEGRFGWSDCRTG